MPIPPSTTEIACQNCGALWSGPIDLSMYYFETSPDQGEVHTTAVDLIALNVEITHCPKCPISRIDSAMQTGADRRHP